MAGLEIPAPPLTGDQADTKTTPGPASVSYADYLGQVEADLSQSHDELVRFEAARTRWNDQMAPMTTFLGTSDAQASSEGLARAQDLLASAKGSLEYWQSHPDEAALLNLKRADGGQLEPAQYWTEAVETANTYIAQRHVGSALEAVGNAEGADRIDALDSARTLAFLSPSMAEIPIRVGETETTFGEYVNGAYQQAAYIPPPGKDYGAEGSFGKNLMGLFQIIGASNEMQSQMTPAGLFYKGYRSPEDLRAAGDQGAERLGRAAEVIIEPLGSASSLGFGLLWAGAASTNDLMEGRPPRLQKMWEESGEQLSRAGYSDPSFWHRSGHARDILAKAANEATPLAAFLPGLTDYPALSGIPDSGPERGRIYGDRVLGLFDVVPVPTRPITAPLSAVGPPGGQGYAICAGGPQGSRGMGPYPGGRRALDGKLFSPLRPGLDIPPGLYRLADRSFADSVRKALRDHRLADVLREIGDGPSLRLTPGGVPGSRHGLLPSAPALAGAPLQPRLSLNPPGLPLWTPPGGRVPPLAPTAHHPQTGGVATLADPKSTSPQHGGGVARQGQLGPQGDGAGYVAGPGPDAGAGPDRNLGTRGTTGVSRSRPRNRAVSRGDAGCVARGAAQNAAAYRARTAAPGAAAPPTHAGGTAGHCPQDSPRSAPGATGRPWSSPSARSWAGGV